MNAETGGWSAADVRGNQLIDTDGQGGPLPSLADSARLLPTLFSQGRQPSMGFTLSPSTLRHSQITGR